MQTRWVAGEDRADVQLAKKHIEKQLYRCRHHRPSFNKSLYLMKQKLGWGDITYKQYNVNRKRPKTDAISPEMIDLIKEHNALDIELYNWVRRQVEHEIQHLDTKSREELKQIKDRLCKGASPDYANPYDFV